MAKATIDTLNGIMDALIAQGLIKMLTPEEYEAKRAAGDFEEWTTVCLEQQEAIDLLVEQTNG